MHTFDNLRCDICCLDCKATKVSILQFLSASFGPPPSEDQCPLAITPDPRIHGSIHQQSTGCILVGLSSSTSAVGSLFVSGPLLNDSDHPTVQQSSPDTIRRKILPRYECVAVKLASSANASLLSLLSHKELQRPIAGQGLCVRAWFWTVSRQCIPELVFG